MEWTKIEEDDDYPDAQVIAVDNYGNLVLGNCFRDDEGYICCETDYGDVVKNIQYYITEDELLKSIKTQISFLNLDQKYKEFKELLSNYSSEDLDKWIKADKERLKFFNKTKS